MNPSMRRWAGPLALIVLGALVCVFVASCASSEEPSDTGPEREVDFWTCSMHPSVNLPEPGQCPICKMDLIPSYAEGEEDEFGPRVFRTSDSAKALMDIQISPVQRKFVDAEIRMVGKVDYDETRLRQITAWVAGRLDRLYVDYTGVPVRKGDHLVYMYSPEVLTAQEELIQALTALESLKSSDIGIIRETAQFTVDATRDKLRLWGLLPEQITEIEKREESCHALSEGLDLVRYVQQTFSMFGGSEEKVALRVDNDLIGPVIDRFGIGIAIQKADENHFTTEVSVNVSPSFLSWVIQFDGKAVITGPDTVVTQMRQLIQQQCRAYQAEEN